MVARQLTTLPVVWVPSGFRFQRVDDEVATRLVVLSLRTPSGLAPDLAGPRVYPVAELLRSHLEATGRRRLIMPMRSSARPLKLRAAPHSSKGRRVRMSTPASRHGDTLLGMPHRRHANCPAGCPRSCDNISSARL
jgi:hypothetical protein